MKRFERFGLIEFLTTVVALALSLVAAIYLAVMTYGQSEACYGMVSGKLLCKKLAPGSQDLAQAAARTSLVLSIVIVLYAVGVAAAWWQNRATAPDARTTAYMIVVTSAVTVFAITLPAVGGPGFYFIPSTLLTMGAAVVGLFHVLRMRRVAAPE
ncbi:MAG TPA: hypothetical protein VJN88_10300 [Ktedonobacterales bacterium]|nr:hypothetical protein [Ktedonobacterales bacterium]